MRSVFVAVAAGLAVFLIAPSSAATNANPPAVPVAPTQRVNHKFVRRPPVGRRPSYATPPGACTTEYTGDYGSFVGLTGANDYAGDQASAILGGQDNEACDAWTAIGGGFGNVVANKIADHFLAENSFIGGGSDNAVTGYNAFIGSGFENESSGAESFVGAGAYNLGQGPGSFVGAGGEAWLNHFSNFPPVPVGNAAYGVDSFVGAGDLNQITSAGNGSFIGGGGYDWATASTNSTTAGNQISGVDSFVGAGDQNVVSGNLDFIGGGTLNSIASAAGEAAIVAGKGNQATAQVAFIGAGNGNHATGPYAFVGAGNGNMAEGSGSFVGGGGSIVVGSTVTGFDSFVGAGDQNAVSGNEAFVGSGTFNSVAASGSFAVIGGGEYNNASGTASVVGGGGYSSARGAYATIPGGYDNAADSTGSFAAGTLAKARNLGAFVWNDNSSSYALQSTANYQFLARASGGFYLYSNSAANVGVKLLPGAGAWSEVSDRHLKTGVVPLDDAAVLDKVSALPISEWSYISENGVRHVGPMAQDFYAAFKVGEDDRHITSIDEDGVALAAIKALDQQNAVLRARLARSDARLAALERRVDALADRAP